MNDPTRPPHPATVAQPRGAAAPAPARPPHPATVAQPERAPHPATVVQPKLAAGGPPARAPHPATAAQPARAPHPATVAQPKLAVGGPAIRPPHPATTVQLARMAPTAATSRPAQPGPVAATGPRTAAPPPAQAAVAQPARKNDFILDIRKVFASLPGYARLVDLFLRSLAAVAPDMLQVLRDDRVTLRFLAKPLEEYANTAIYYVAGGKKLHLVDALDKGLVGKTGDGQVVIVITFNSNRRSRTGPTLGGAMLATLAHEVFDHVGPHLRFIEYALRILGGGSLEGKEKKAIHSLASSRTWKQRTIEEHRALAVGNDSALEARLAAFHTFLRRHFPTLADEFITEMEDDRRNHGSRLKGPQLRTYVGFEVFDSNDVRNIVRAGLEALEAFGRVHGFNGLLRGDMLRELAAMGRSREITDEQYEALKRKYLAIHLQVSNALSLARMYDWSERHLLGLLRTGALRWDKDGNIVSDSSQQERPLHDYSSEYIS